MWGWLRTEIKKLTGTRRFAAGALALYSVGWLSERALTLFWEHLLERQAPLALRQVSNILATDLATGMALMALLALFVPPVAQWIFEASASLARFMELRSKRVSRRDYLAQISDEAILLAQEARAIAVYGRWDNDGLELAELSPQDAWNAREKHRVEQLQRQGKALQEFVATKLGRANFLQQEFVDYGFAHGVPRVFEHITNYNCVSDLANALENAANKTRSSLLRDGFSFGSPVSETRV